jgi:hypothetical protein
MLTGTISTANTAVGQLTIGGAILDYAAYLATDADYAPALGELVEVIGVQPAPGGTIVVAP